MGYLVRLPRRTRGLAMKRRWYLASGYAAPPERCQALVGSAEVARSGTRRLRPARRRTSVVVAIGLLRCSVLGGPSPPSSLPALLGARSPVTAGGDGEPWHIVPASAFFFFQPSRRGVAGPRAPMGDGPVRTPSRCRSEHRRRRGRGPISRMGKAPIFTPEIGAFPCFPIRSAGLVWRAERWPSGLRQRFAKPSYGVNLYRGFESPPLRQFFEPRRPRFQ